MSLNIILDENSATAYIEGFHIVTCENCDHDLIKGSNPDTCSGCGAEGKPDCYDNYIFKFVSAFLDEHQVNQISFKAYLDTHAIKNNEIIVK